MSCGSTWLNTPKSLSWQLFMLTYISLKGYSVETHLNHSSARIPVGHFGSDATELGCRVQLEKENSCAGHSGEWWGWWGPAQRSRGSALFPLSCLVGFRLPLLLGSGCILCAPRRCASLPKMSLLPNKLCYLGLNWGVTSFLFPLGYHYNLSLYFGPSASVHGVSYLNWAHPEEAPLWTLPTVAERWWRWGKFWCWSSCSLPVSALIWCGGNGCR